MKVSRQIEPLVREAFAASIVQEKGRFTTSIDVIVERGDGPFTEALNLAVDVCRTALFSIHNGHRPDADQLAYLAGGFDDSESWVGLSRGDALIFLTSLADLEPVTDTLSLKVITPMAFAMGGWLLAAFLPEDKHWYDFLDEILVLIEATPERS